MDNKLIIDAVFALVLLLGAVFGAKRGLFRSLMALAAIIAALIGASLLTDLLTEPVTDMLMPRVEKSVEEWFDTSSEAAKGDTPQIEGETTAENDATGETPDSDAAQGAENVRQDDPPLAVTGLLKKLLRFDLDGAVRQTLRNAARDAAFAAVRTLLGSVVRTLVFVLCFLVFTVLLRLVTAGVDKVLDLPVLNALNTLGGGALGFIESALLLFLVCDLAPKLGVEAFTEYEGTYLLAFFMSHTPRGLVAALLP